MSSNNTGQEQNSPGEDERSLNPTARLNKQQVIKEDGRYLIFYSSKVTHAGEETKPGKTTQE